MGKDNNIIIGQIRKIIKQTNKIKPFFNFEETLENMENKQASSFIFGIIAIIVGSALYREFDFQNLNFQDINF